MANAGMDLKGGEMNGSGPVAANDVGVAEVPDDGRCEGDGGDGDGGVHGMTTVGVR